MKRTLLTVATAILLSVHAVAQYDRDTVYFGDPLYMYNPPTQLFNISGRYFYYGFSPTRIALGYYPTEPTWVHGVALTVGNYGIRHSIDHDWCYASAEYIQPSCFAALLLQKDPATGELRLVDSVQWHYPPPTRIMCINTVNLRALDGGDDYTYPLGDTSLIYSKNIEFYFQTPHLMSDSFYVGITYEHDARRYPELAECLDSFALVSPGTDPTSMDPFYFPFDTSFSAKWIYFPERDNFSNYVEDITPLSAWLMYDSVTLSYMAEGLDIDTLSLWGGIYPIRYPYADGCSAPTRLWLGGWDEYGGVSLLWAPYNDSVELAIGDYMGSPDTALMVIALPPNDSGYTATGLTPETYYGAWLRRRCHWHMPDGDTAVWSAWSPKLIFNSGHATGLDASVRQPVVSVYPNPAHDVFTVTVDRLPATLDLYNALGTRLYSATLRSTATTIGIADLPPGFFYVTVTDPRGSTTRRLVRQ